MRKDNSKKEAGEIVKLSENRTAEKAAVLFRLLFLVSVFIVVLEFFDYLGGREEYGAIKDIFVAYDAEKEKYHSESGAGEEKANTDTAESADSVSTVESHGEIVYIDFAGLQALNPDIAAWIRIPGTNVDYPVMFRAEDSGYYLTHTTEGKRAKVGAIHLDGASAGTESRNLIIYGHDLLDGSMFSSLHRYESKRFYEEHPYVYLYLPDGSIRQYRIASVILIERADTSLYMVDFCDDETAQTYYDMLLERSIYYTGTRVTASEEKQTILLSTCYKKQWKRLILAVLDDQ